MRKRLLPVSGKLVDRLCRLLLHGFSVTNIEPRLLPFPPAINETPDTEMTFSTSGIVRISDETFFTIESVRSSDAPVGNCTEVMK